MPANVVKTEADERHWRMAKEAAREQGHAKDYAYIMGIFKQMSKGGDAIPGGLAAGKTNKDFDAEQLAAGIKVEMEHTTSRKIAAEIARDHLTEDPSYYRKLKKIEAKSLYPADEEPDLRKPSAAKSDDSDEAKIQEGLKRQAKKHRRLADEHRRAQPKGGGTMGRWRQERAHEDAQEAHREAAESSEEAVSDSSKRDEAQDESDAAFTHPQAEEVKSMNPIVKSLGRLMKAQGAGPFRGPKGGLWADAGHTQPWKPDGKAGKARRKASHTAHAIHHERKALEATNRGEATQASAHMDAAAAHKHAGKVGSFEHSTRAHEATKRADKAKSRLAEGESIERTAHHVRQRNQHLDTAARLRGSTNQARQLGITSTVDSLAREHEDAATLHGHAAKRHTANHPKADSHSQAAHDHSRSISEAASKAPPKAPAGDNASIMGGGLPYPEASKEVGSYHGQAKSHHIERAAHELAAGRRQSAMMHALAGKLHGEAQDYHEDGHEDAGYRSQMAQDATRAAHADSGGGLRDIGTMTAGDPMERSMSPFADLIKAAEATSAKASEALGKPPAKPDPKAEAGDKPEDEEGGDEQGTHEHHRDRALAHLQAAQAHATAAHSAKKVEAAQEHGKVVGNAEQASQAAQAMAPEPGKGQPAGKEQPVKKSEGEGSRGGKVIGHTSSGKPVYARDTQTMAVRDFSDKEHHEAAVLHHKEATKHAEARNNSEAMHHQDKRDQHQSYATRKQYLESGPVVTHYAGKPATKVPRLDEPVKKSIPFKSHSIDISSEDAVLAHLDGGAVVGGQMAALRYDGRDRLLGMRGERMAKSGTLGEPGEGGGGIAGGTIYQGEHSGPRGGDLRETAMRAQCLAETVHLDPDGTDGQGGDSAWWKDAAAENPAEVRMRRLVTKSNNPTVRIIDDADPVTKAHRNDVNRVGLSVEMAYHGGGRETKRSGR